ncbi:cytokine receptor isoform X2 [Condylostylus longicornis]|uniref:cytokine receptor isoform X2 n=1 Tax=Condylostylus longicornis TaxID=2530218 RepID=UPI00244E2D51|nr:cytokine receptor isoform X2 [Condylostylus longicornis]
MDFKLKFLSSFFILFVIFYHEVTSSDGRVGEILPNDREILVGTELVLICSVNVTFNCGKMLESDRGFSFEYKNLTRVPDEYITPLNLSAIELRIPNAPMMNERFKCYCNNDAIDYAYVRVGTPPQNVTDFDCVGYNFEYLTCSFSESTNPAYETYSLEYSVSHEQYVHDCIGLNLDPSSNKYVCNITGIAYYQVHENYNFTLKINNSLGSLNQSFNINQVDKMKPATPNLTLVKSTFDSLMFSWTYSRAPFFKNCKGYSLIFEIKYLPELNKKEKNDDDFILYNVTIPDSKNTINYTIKLENLEYAYTWYDIRVRLRVKSPKVKDTPWSDTCKITSQTGSRTPDSAPKTDVGSFYIDNSNRKVNLYWETLASYKQNGKNTRYIVKSIIVNGIKMNLQALKMALNTATYHYNSSNEYEFRIKSVNEIGESNNYSVIRIPRRDEYPKDYYLPRYFNKIFHNNSYELTWDEPINYKYQLQDYTVFWCKSTQESHTDCENSDEGSIHFERVDKNQKNFTKPKINIDYHLNFGVSANYEHFSSGIVWAPCTGRKTGDFDEVQVLSSKAEKQTITISWNLDCVYRPILKGYNLTYCPYTENVNGLTQGIEPNCTEPEQYINITKNKAPGEYVLRNLKPYKSYKININMFSETKSGPKLSKPIYATTMEAAPSIPRNLVLVNKTSNYATIQWEVPENKNGDIRYYEIFYNENSKKLEKVKIPDNSSIITYRLEHLKSFHNYKVYVIAFTVSPSSRSNDLTFKTWMGQPDSLKTASSDLQNSDKKIIMWDPPVDPAASKISFYKITINSKQGDKRPFQVVSFVTENKCTFRPVCKTFEIKAEVKGAAVNAIPKEEFDFERFEHIGFFPCGNPTSNETASPDDHEVSSTFSYLQSEFDEFDFTCEEDIRNTKSKFNDKYCGTREYKFLAGNDELIYGFECNLGKKELTQTLFLVLAISVFVFAMSMSTFFGVKKFKKMKNIDFVLPPGLDDLNQLENNKNNQGKPSIERQNIEKVNENLHLLSSIDNGSIGYLNCSESEKSYDVNCSNDVICNNDDAQSSTQSQNSEEMSDMSNQSNHSSRSESPNLSDLQSRKEMNFIMQPQNGLNNTGNISAGDGYVQQSVLQKHPPPSSVGNGYTVLETLGNKPTIITNPMPTSSIDTSNYVNPSSINLVAKPKVFLTSTTNPNNPTLAGYVTHKQLSDYGQQKRH